MDYIQILGFVAAVFTTGANFPQTYKIIKTKSTKDISTITYAMLLAGGIMWIAYGVLRKDIPVTIANGKSVTICAIILILKCASKKQLDDLNKKI